MTRDPFQLIRLSRSPIIARWVRAARKGVRGGGRLAYVGDRPIGLGAGYGIDGFGVGLETGSDLLDQLADHPNVERLFDELTRFAQPVQRPQAGRKLLADGPAELPYILDPTQLPQGVSVGQLGGQIVHATGLFEDQSGPLWLSFG